MNAMKDTYITSAVNSAGGVREDFVIEMMGIFESATMKEAPKDLPQPSRISLQGMQML